MVEAWSTRKRKFMDAFETILESAGMNKKKMGDDIGAAQSPCLPRHSTHL
jgi:hypothetical protein